MRELGGWRPRRGGHPSPRQIPPHRPQSPRPPRAATEAAAPPTSALRPEIQFAFGFCSAGSPLCASRRRAARGSTTSATNPARSASSTSENPSARTSCPPDAPPGIHAAPPDPPPPTGVSGRQCGRWGRESGDRGGGARRGAGGGRLWEGSGATQFFLPCSSKSGARSSADTHSPILSSHAASRIMERLRWPSPRPPRPPSPAGFGSPVPRPAGDTARCCAGSS